ncbi:MAG TPA: amino acid permease, partial [Chthonomonadaceae bacterium]|nr:amino acid permease [Chthonomonadaceae bacterium]
MGRGVLYYVTIGSVLTVLALSANTSFAGFPRLCRLIAEDDFLPHAFANVGRRLVYSYGIVILAVFAGALLIVFRGITDRLIPLFAVGAFGAFTLSQAGMVMHWKRHPGPRTGLSMAVNAVGAVATAAALIVILVAKFVEGAWITLVLIPGMLFLFARVRRHYDYVKKQIRCPHPLDLRNNDPPIVIVPIKGWDILTERALRFGLRLSPDVIAVHVALQPEEAEKPLRALWAREVEAPARQAGLNPPQLVVLPSPYRRLFTPLLDYVDQVLTENPNRIVAVVIPELAETHWYEYLLHNQRATVLKVLLYLRGHQRVVVINVPWYLQPESAFSQQQPSLRPALTRSKERHE